MQYNKPPMYNNQKNTRKMNKTKVFKKRKNNKTKPLPNTQNERRVSKLWSGLSKEEKALSKRYEKLKTQ